MMMSRAIVALTGLSLLWSGIVEACTDPNCAACSEDPNTCTECKAGYGKLGTAEIGRTCQACKSDCDICSEDANTCTECTHGKYLDKHNDCVTTCPVGSISTAGYTKDGTDVGRTCQGNCHDTVNWDDGTGQGRNCDWYAEHVCSGGLYTGRDFPAFNHPGQHCCACGKQVPQTVSVDGVRSGSGAKPGATWTLLKELRRGAFTSATATSTSSDSASSDSALHCAEKARDAGDGDNYFFIYRPATASETGKCDVAKGMMVEWEEDVQVRTGSDPVDSYLYQKTTLSANGINGENGGTWNLQANLLNGKFTSPYVEVKKDSGASAGPWDSAADCAGYAAAGGSYFIIYKAAENDDDARCYAATTMSTRHETDVIDEKLDSHSSPHKLKGFVNEYLYEKSTSETFDFLGTLFVFVAAALLAMLLVFSVVRKHHGPWFGSRQPLLGIDA